MNGEMLFRAIRAAVSLANQLLALGDFTGPLSGANRQTTIAQLEHDLETVRKFVEVLKK